EKQAEKLYRQAAQESTAPDAMLVVAAFLGRHRRLREALDLCDPLWATSKRPEAVAQVATVALYANPPDQRQSQRVEQRLREVLQKEPENLPLLLALASVHNLQGRPKEAEDGYRKILELEPNNEIALNNLSWILAHKEDPQGKALKDALDMMQT